GAKRHQHGDQDDERHPESRLAALTAQPRHGGQFAELQRHAHANDRECGDDEYAGHAGDGKACRHSGQGQSRYGGCGRNAATIVTRDGQRGGHCWRRRYGVTRNGGLALLGPVLALAQGVTGRVPPHFRGGLSWIGVTSAICTRSESPSCRIPRVAIISTADTAARSPFGTILVSGVSSSRLNITASSRSVRVRAALAPPDVDRERAQPVGAVPAVRG